MAYTDKLTQVQLDAMQGSAQGAGSAKKKSAVATRSRVYGYAPVSASTPNINNVVATYRSRHVIMNDCTDIQFKYGNHTPSAPGANPITLECVIERIGTDNIPVFYTQAFNGVPSIVVAPGGTVETDSFSLELSKGDIIYVRTLVTVASLSDKRPSGMSLFPSPHGEAVVPGNFLLDSTFKWNFTNLPQWGAAANKAIGAIVLGNPFNHYYYEAMVAGVTGATMPVWPANEGDTVVDGTVTWKAKHVAEESYGYSPLAIIAKTYKPEVSVAIAGDSIAWGGGDANPANNLKGDNFGFIVRALEALNIGYVNLSHPGNRTTHFMGTSRLYSTQLLEHCTHFIGEYGINDVNAPLNINTIKANIIDICKMARNRGLKVYWTTLAPLSTSTDGWATTANQTAKYKDVRAELNNWIRNGADGNIDGCIDSGATVEEGENTGIWKVGRVLTTDNLGIHPNQAGHADMAQPVQQEVSTWTV